MFLWLLSMVQVEGICRWQVSYLAAAHTAHRFTATLESRRIILKDNGNTTLHTTLHTTHSCVGAALRTGTSGEYSCHYLWVAAATVTRQ